jgi:predicted MFS family arabinose efflux permease
VKILLIASSQATSKPRLGLLQVRIDTLARQRGVLFFPLVHARPARRHRSALAAQRESAASLRPIFFLTFVPGLLATLMILFVRDRPIAAAAKTKLDLNIRRFSARYWKYLAVTAIFGVGNSSNAFLILRTKDLGASLTSTIFIYALYNLIAALASYPAGYLSDTLGRRGVLLISFLVFILVYAGFGFSTNIALIGVLFVFYGVYQGIFRAVGKAMATDFLPSELHASGIGWFTTVVGVSGLVASIVGGQLWTRVGPPPTFLFGAAFALLGSIALLVLVPQSKQAANV